MKQKLKAHSDKLVPLADLNLLGRLLFTDCLENCSGKINSDIAMFQKTSSYQQL